MLQTIDNTIGAAFLGIVASSILYGITLIQTYTYFSRYSEDWKFLRISVGILLVLDTLHLAFVVHAVYHYAVTSFGNPVALLFVVWSVKMTNIAIVLIVLLVQSLYAVRVWKLSQGLSRVWPTLVAILVGMGYGVGIMLAIKIYQSPTFAAVDQEAWVIQISFATATGVDIVLASAMCYYLGKNRSSFPSKTRHQIIRIMRYVLISGLLTSVCSFTCLITYVTMPDTMVFLGLQFVLTRLYVNSYLSMLNARKSLRNVDSSTSGVSRLTNPRTQVNSQRANNVNDRDNGLSSLSTTESSNQSDKNLSNHYTGRIKQNESALFTDGVVHIHRTQELYCEDGTLYQFPV